MSLVQAELVDARCLSPSVRLLALRPEAPVTFVAGQWIHVHADVDGETVKRAYSIANAPRPDGLLELAVTRVDDGCLSPQLHALEPGARLAIDGPHGFFTREAALRERPSLFVGTGTGLAPLRAMLQSTLDDPQRPPLALLFGCRSPDDVLWADEQAAFQTAGVRVERTLSRPSVAWTGRRGYVQEHVAQLARELGEPDVYICGLSKMVRAVREVLKGELGYDRKRIHSERYD